MHHEEIEVKFIIDDVAAMRQRLMSCGATLTIPRTYEDNWCLDTPDHRLLQQGCLLRLRRDQRNILTYKEPQTQEDLEFKIRHEYEVEISDFKEAQSIFAKLGFLPLMRYEKYRETYSYGGAEIVLDEVPVGCFMEIEGSRERIRSIARSLELDFDSRLLASYGEIFDAVCATYQLQMNDMTFDNFRPMTIDLRRCNLH